MVLLLLVHKRLYDRLLLCRALVHKRLYDRLLLGSMIGSPLQGCDRMHVISFSLGA